MPCLILTGHPCAGKTTLAKKLQERALLEKHSAWIDKVVLINEESECPDFTKNKCYANSNAEKKTRAALKSAFDRAVGSNGGGGGGGGGGGNNSSNKTLVILDSLNYIKGFRYELFCISKAAGERHGVLWVLNRHNVLTEWNANRTSTSTSSSDTVEEGEGYSYEPSVLQELVTRYEPPDERNRWDKPLYTVDVAPLLSSSSSPSATTTTTENDASKAATTDALQRSVYNMHDLEKSLVGEKATTTETTTLSTTASAPKKRPVKSAFQRATKPKAAAIASTTDENASDAATKGAATITTITATTDDSTASHLLTTRSTETTNDASNNNNQETKKTLDEQLDEILDSFLRKVQPLKEGMSTRRHEAGDANVLQELDSITQLIVSAVSTAQNSRTAGKLVINETTNGMTFSMDYKRPIALTELRRLRKQYLQWVANHPPDDTTERGIATSFLQYIDAQL
jgi:protein KTI12